MYLSDLDAIAHTILRCMLLGNPHWKLWKFILQMQESLLYLLQQTTLKEYDYNSCFNPVCCYKTMYSSRARHLFEAAKWKSLLRPNFSFIVSEKEGSNTNEKLFSDSCLKSHWAFVDRKPVVVVEQLGPQTYFTPCRNEFRIPVHYPYQESLEPRKHICLQQT